MDSIFEWNGHLYRLTSAELNWDEAEAEAVRLGGHLVTINSAEEQQFLEDTFMSGANDRTRYWIGLNDVANEGNFVWVNGELVTFTNWDLGEPNNNKNDEHYTVVNWNYAVGGGIKRTWNDIDVTGRGDSYFGIIEIMTDGNDTIIGNRIIDGFEGDDVLIGGADSDTLNGGPGDDDLNGGPDHDNLNGGTGNDDLDGGSGKDTLNGDSGDDILIGGADADLLNGGSGADVLIGKAGNDTYIVDNLNDIIIEKNNGGKDIVKSSVNYELAANLENLTLTGNKAIAGTDNKLRNNIKGNKKDNNIEGLGGNDTLKGSSGNDTLSGGDGADNLNGQAGNDDLFGGNHNDKLIGGGGSDHLFGESGNDNLKGNGGNDSLDGGSGKDTLIGASGNDVLTGGRGKDVLTGGSGSDEFVFNSFREGADRITDFAVRQDKIVVSAGGFGGGLVQGNTLSSQQFTFGDEATSATHRFIYSLSGDLFFDQDGSGEMEQFHLATFSGIPFLFHTDIEVVA